MELCAKCHGHPQTGQQLQSRLYIAPRVYSGWAASKRFSTTSSRHLAKMSAQVPCAQEVVLVTGASRGLGLEMTKQLLEVGTLPCD